MQVIYFIGLLIITTLIHFILYAIYRYDKKKEQEEIMIKNASFILKKLDENKFGGKKMDQDIKNLARYLTKKIDEAKEEILDRLDEIEENSEEEPEEDDIFDEDEELEEDDNIEVTVLEDIEQPKPKIKSALDKSKRQIKIEQDEAPKRKKGLFGMKI